MAIQVKRGTEAAFIPGSLLPGEPAYTLDTHKLMIGNADSSVTLLPTNEAVTAQITARIASQAEAEAGTDNIKLMTPLRVWQAIKKAALSIGNPVGTIRMSIDNTNPSTYIGGTWIAWGVGRAPVGVDTTQTEFSAAGKTGGSKTHTLTNDEIGYKDYGTVGAGGTYLGIHDHAKSGASYQPFSILQPYITCYMWLRTA